jgi:hypothetical protein
MYDADVDVACVSLSATPLVGSELQSLRLRATECRR